MFFVSFGVLSEFIGPANQTLIRKNHRLFVNEVFTIDLFNQSVLIQTSS